MEIVANVSIVVILSLEANIIDRFSSRESIVNKIEHSFLFSLFFFWKRSIDEIYLSKKVNYFFFFFFFRSNEYLTEAED